MSRLQRLILATSLAGALVVVGYAAVLVLAVVRSPSCDVAIDELLAEHRNAPWVKLDELPNHVLEATLSATDAKFLVRRPDTVSRVAEIAFWAHRASSGAPMRGLRIDGSVSDGVATALLGPIEYADLTNEHWLDRRILAYRLERHLTRHQLIEVLLNVASFGGSIGILDASRETFDIEAPQVSVGQAHTLGAMMTMPRKLRTRGWMRDRANYMLMQTYERGAISRQQFDEALIDLRAFTTAEEPAP